VGLLRLELDIDADVYPELHATLTSLVSEASRGERMRQLAAAGLVWEKLRIRGQAALNGVAEAAPLGGSGGSSGPALPPAPAPRAARASAPRAPAAARSPAPVPVPAMPAAPPRSGPPGFVDLALDAEPAPAPALFVPAPVAPAIPVAAPWPPVLMDVVDPDSFVTAMPIAMAEERSSRPMPLAPSSLPLPPSPPPSLLSSLPPSPSLTTPSQPRAVDLMQDDSASRSDVVVEPPIEHRSSTRSRLQRMKEKGLFKNG
jgi:hypothetical protein